MRGIGTWLCFFTCFAMVQIWHLSSSSWPHLPTFSLLKSFHSTQWLNRALSGWLRRRWTISRFREASSSAEKAARAHGSACFLEPTYKASTCSTATKAGGPSNLSSFHFDLFLFVFSTVFRVYYRPVWTISVRFFGRRCRHRRRLACLGSPSIDAHIPGSYSV